MIKVLVLSRSWQQMDLSDLEEHLVLFVTRQNLVRFGAVVSIIRKLSILCVRLENAHFRPQLTSWPSLHTLLVVWNTQSKSRVTCPDCRPCSSSHLAGSCAHACWTDSWQESADSSLQGGGDVCRNTKINDPKYTPHATSQPTPYSGRPLVSQFSLKGGV